MYSTAALASSSVMGSPRRAYSAYAHQQTTGYDQLNTTARQNTTKCGSLTQRPDTKASKLVETRHGPHGSQVDGAQRAEHNWCCKSQPGQNGDRPPKPAQPAQHSHTALEFSDNVEKNVHVAPARAAIRRHGCETTRTCKSDARKYPVRSVSNRSKIFFISSSSSSVMCTTVPSRREET